MQSRRTVTGAAALLLAVFHVIDIRAATVDAAAAAAMDRFLGDQTAAPAYRGSRHLEAAGSGQRGWLDADTEFTARAGLRYVVTSEGGSGYIRSRVLRSLLEQEQQLIASGGSAGVAISPANYRFTPAGIDASGLARVGLQPRRKERPLIVGQLFLAPGNGEIVRVEGRLARNPSLWITRVNIVRTYRRINGIAVPVLLESAAQLRLLGRSTLRMTYRYDEINDSPIVDEGRQ